MVELDAVEAGPRVVELLERALRGEQVIITQNGDRFSLSSMVPPEDVERHLADLRRQLAGHAPAIMAAEFDADLAAMRGRT